MTHEILVALEAYVNDVGRALAQFLPRLLAAVLMLLLGYLAAFVLRAVTRRVLRWLRFNALMERTGARQFMERAQLGQPDQLLASSIFWLAWLALIFSVVRTLGVAAVDGLAHDFVRYLPKLVSAVLILVLGLFLSNVAWRTALLAAVNARVPGAKRVAALVRAVTLIAALAMAVEQLEIGRQVILTAFAISFGAVMLALAIAFGLGGRHLARRYLEQRLPAQPPEARTQGERNSHL